MEQFTGKRWLVLEKLLTKKSQSSLHDEAAATSASHGATRFSWDVQLKQHGFSKFKLYNSGQCSG